MLLALCSISNLLDRFEFNQQVLMMLLLVFRRLITLANPRLFFHPAEQRWGSFSLCIWYYRESLISAAFMLIFKHYPVLLSLEAKKDVLVQIPPAE